MALAQAQEKTKPVRRSLGLAISVWNPKGGVGKSVFSQAIASAFAAAGYTVQLVDLDPQRDAMLWAEMVRKDGREPAFNVSTTAQPGQFDVVVYDHPPGLPQNARLPGQFVVVPTPLDARSLAPTMRGVADLKAMGKPFIVVPNRVEVASASQSQLIAGTFAGTPFIRKRVAFQRLYDTAYALYDEGTGVPLIGAARSDFDALMKVIIDMAKKTAAKA